MASVDPEEKGLSCRESLLVTPELARNGILFIYCTFELFEVVVVVVGRFVVLVGRPFP